jgi:hypothetical protein
MPKPETASLFTAEGVDAKTAHESFRYSTNKITLGLCAQATTPKKLAAQRRLIDAIIPKTYLPTVLMTINS